jgi:hypothetical protein
MVIWLRNNPLLCLPNAAFAELVCLSKANLAGEYYAERSGNRWISE